MHTIPYQRLLLVTTLLAFLADGAILPAQDAALTLEKYENEAAGFRADMFPNPKYQTDSKKFKDGDTDFTITSHGVVSTHGKSAYAVSVTGIPPLESLPEKDPEVIIRSQLNNAIKNFKNVAKEKQEFPVTHNGLRGTELRLANSNTKEGARVRVFLEGNRIYQLLAAGPLDIVNSKQTEHFFDSFLVLKDEPQLAEPIVNLEKYESKAAGFSADMFPSPGYITKTSKGKGKDANTDIEIRLITSQHGTNAYLVVVTDIPRSDASNENDSKSILENSKNAFLKQHQRKTPNKQEQSVTVEGIKGHEVRLSNPSTETGVSLRTFFENGRKYELIAGGSLEMMNSKLTDRFFNSFRLLKD